MSLYRGWYAWFTVVFVFSLLTTSLALVVKASASRAADLGFDSCLHQDLSCVSHTGDFEIGTPVGTLPDTWPYRVSAGWDRKFDPRLSQSGSTRSCLSRSIPEVHQHVAGTLHNQPSSQPANRPICLLWTCLSSPVAGCPH